MTLSANQIAAVTRTPPAAVIAGVEMHFRSGVQRYSAEAAPVVIDGVTWSRGDRLLGDLPGALEAVGLSAATATVILSGLDAAWAELLITDWPDTESQLVRTAALYVDPLTRAGLVGGVIYTGAYRFAKVDYDNTAMQIDPAAPQTITLKVVLEGWFRGRRSPQLQYLTHAGQQAAYPNDTGFQYLVELERLRRTGPGV